MSPAPPAAHPVSFRGELVYEPVGARADDLWLVDQAGAGRAAPVTAGEIVPVGPQPRRLAAEEAGELAARLRPARIIAVGDGATLDVAKYAWRRAGAGPALVLVPVGAEPWRAFAPFTSLYEPDGGRVSRPDPQLATARVVLDRPALAKRPSPVTALARADSTVHAVEVLLNTRAGDWQRALALAGLAALAGGETSDAAAGAEVVGAGLATEAFTSTGLGLAHALASPLGAQAGRSHDTVNVIVAPYVVRHWGDRVDWSTVASALGVAADVAGALSRLREAAGLPAGLREAGLSREQVQAAAPAALRSSGIPWLPAPVTAAEVSAVLEQAWAGD